MGSGSWAVPGAKKCGCSHCSCFSLMKIHCTAKWCRQLLAHFLFLCLTVCELPLRWLFLCLGDHVLEEVELIRAFVSCYLKKLRRSVLLFLVTFSFFFIAVSFALTKCGARAVCVHNTAQQSWQNGRVIYEFCCWLKKKIYINCRRFVAPDCTMTV